MYLPPTWHCAQAVCTCAPVSAKRALLWSNVAPCQRAVVWHAVQSCGNPAAAWFGLVVFW